MLDLVLARKPVLGDACDKAFEVGKHNGFERGPESSRRLAADDVAVKISEMRIVCPDGGEGGPVGDVGRCIVGPVEAVLDRGDPRCETGDLRKPVLNRAGAIGAAPIMCVGLAELDYGEAWGEEKDGRETPQIDIVPCLVPPERKQHAHGARVVPQDGIDARIGVD